MILKFNHSAIEKDILLPNISVILVEEGIQAIFKTIFYTIQFTASLQYSHATCAVLHGITLWRQTVPGTISTEQTRHSLNAATPWNVQSLLMSLQLERVKASLKRKTDT